MTLGFLSDIGAFTGTVPANVFGRRAPVESSYHRARPEKCHACVVAVLSLQLQVVFPMCASPGATNLSRPARVAQELRFTEPQLQQAVLAIVQDSHLRKLGSSLLL